MTIRLYYSDPSCRRFDAVVVRALDHGGRPAVVLDRTAFYPASGGQPADRGRLGPAAVVDVVDAEDDVVHVLSCALNAGAPVQGEIDWVRRFDHMQQHTGQHVLSAAFERLSGHRTVSFHMSDAASTIDLTREASAADIDAAMDLANTIVWENYPVDIRFVSAAEASVLPLRNEPVRGGSLRLIDIAGFDLSACGGTHTASTGAVGLIAVLASERMRGGSRLTFVCGRRALGTLCRYRDAVASGVHALSTTPAELPSAIERLQVEARDLRRTVRDLQETLAVAEGERLAAAARELAGVRVVIQVLDGWDVAGLKLIAAAAAGSSRSCIVLLTAARPVSLLVACAPSVPIDAHVLLLRLTSQFGGRGGGKQALAQGGGLDGDPQDVAAAARTLVEATLA